MNFVISIKSWGFIKMFCYLKNSLKEFLGTVKGNNIILKGGIISVDFT